MIAPWMAYAAAVSLLGGLGALAVEHALVLYGRPTRWVWAAAMALSAAVPLAARFAPHPEFAPVFSASGGAEAAPAGQATTHAAPILLRVTEDGGRRAVALDAPLLAGWITASAALAALLAAMETMLARRRRAWRREVVDGVAVLVSEDAGPAVMGLFRSDIVVPEWVLHASPAKRELMLVHEEEHVRAGDPRLLGLALALLVLMPWSPALWWQLRRLRLAVEVDCDARVLARRADVRSYGALLLEMGRRASAGMLAVAAFSEPVSSLERRIRIMTAPRVRTRLLRASGFAGAAVTFAAAASATPHPQLPPSAARPASVASATIAAAALPTAAPLPPTPPRAASPRPSVAPPVAAEAPSAPEAPSVAAASRAAAPAWGASPVPGVAPAGSASADSHAAPVAPALARDTTPGATPGVLALVRRYFPDVLVSGMHGDRYLHFTLDRDGRVLGAAATRDFPRDGADAPGVHTAGVMVLYPAGALGPDTVTLALTQTATLSATHLLALVGASERDPARGRSVSAADVIEAIDRYFPRVRAQGAPEPLVFVADADGSVVRHGVRSQVAMPPRAELDAIQGFDGNAIVLDGHAVSVQWVRLKRASAPRARSDR